MKLMTEPEAKEKICPDLVTFKCMLGRCMAWNIVENRVEREDHSGAKQLMYEELRRRSIGAEVKRSGPDGCQGIYYIEARGYCSKYQNLHIKKNEPNS
jgi:hypothetical protein